MISLNDVRRVTSRPVIRPEAPRHAAVAVVLTPGLELLFMRRAEWEGDPWSGHVSFPGGGVEPGDADLRAAAVRETREELGIDLGQAEHLGALDAVAPITGLKAVAVHPFVFALDREPALAPNREVASVHRRSLAALLAGEGRSVMPYRWQGRAIELPCVDFDGIRLWGLTLRVVDDLLERLREPVDGSPPTRTL